MATSIKTNSLGSTEISIEPHQLIFKDGDDQVTGVELSNETILHAASEIKELVDCLGRTTRRTVARVPDEIREMAADFDLTQAAKICPELNPNQLEIELHKLRASLRGGKNSALWLSEREILGTRSLLF